MNKKAKKVPEKSLILIYGQIRPRIRIRNPESGMRIRILIQIKPWIQIRIKADADSKHWKKPGFYLSTDLAGPPV